MRIKIPSDLLIIDICVILLIIFINLLPENVARVVLGLPFLLFFPGYVLVATLFPQRKWSMSSGTGKTAREISKEGTEQPSAGKQEMDVIERIALSFGMSIAVTALIGLGLNYTPWGIRLLPVLYSISAFIIILSIVAHIRRMHYHTAKLISEVTVRLPGWEGSPLNKTLTVILTLAILSAIGVLIYTVANPRVGERFTEFYILGIRGKAADYPREFILKDGKVAEVKYGSENATRDRLASIAEQYGTQVATLAEEMAGGETGQVTIAENYGRITLGIVNHEQKETPYTVSLHIDGVQVPILFEGSIVEQLGPISLGNGEKWEKEIGIVPLHTGENQKVEFFLYKDGSEQAYLNLHLWINVIE